MANVSLMQNHIRTIENHERLIYYLYSTLKVICKGNCVICSKLDKAAL